MKRVLPALLALLLCASLGAAPIFVVAPYLQPGPRLHLRWGAGEGEWKVRYKSGGDWQTAAQPSFRAVKPERTPSFRLYDAELPGVGPGAAFQYEVLFQGKRVFAAEARAGAAPGRPSRFVVFGDCGVGSPEQRQVTWRTFQERPDYVVLAGDLVYSKGRTSEYLAWFFPIYNAERAAPDQGAPLMRSTLFLPCIGNHDTQVPRGDGVRFGDAMAYFIFWNLPLNGPLAEGSPWAPRFQGSAEATRRFREAVTPGGYPRMANYSIEQGDVHWTFLDGCRWTDWTRPELRDWVRKDLESARSAAWRFVVVHQPPFHSSREHFQEQRMRLLAEVLEQGRVDVVFSGHVHNYERSCPLRFKPGKMQTDGTVAGNFTLDKSYDGARKTRPDGVIYLVTGAGGAGLYDPEQSDRPDTWQPYTRVFKAREHSLTVCQVEGKKLTVRQISAASGKELDRFVVTR